MRGKAAIFILQGLLLTSCTARMTSDAPAPISTVSVAASVSTPLPELTHTAPPPMEVEIREDFWYGKWRSIELTEPIDFNELLDGTDALPLLLVGDMGTDLRAILETSPGFPEKTSWFLTEPEEGEYLGCYRNMEGGGRRFELFFFCTDPDGGPDRYILAVTDETDDSRQVVKLAPRDGWVQDGSFALEDLNFDGQMDIKIFAGHYGASEHDIALLWDEELGEYREELSFEEIPSPIPDPEQKIVRGSWRSSAYSHGWGIWEYRDGVFVQTRRLTIGEEYNTGAHDHTVWCVEEALADGGLRETARYDVSAATEYDRVTEAYYEPDSFWGMRERDYFKPC